MHIVHSIAACPKVYDGCTSASSVLPVTWRRRGGYFSLLVHSHVYCTRYVWLKKKVYFVGCFLFEIVWTLLGSANIRKPMFAFRRP